ncbi:OmpA family protein [Marivirga sp. S37H4]|uniref:OmpA family protein n=1 Tax=Marivirga aurantiaca TaxID=2802615 RepID=A0A935CCZ2_9BACT|nr:OmpA family protein [Marivirga aurantiaca]MBK6266428.1 OmpA family protein [Marivirga aurantiaca]
MKSIYLLLSFCFIYSAYGQENSQRKVVEGISSNKYTEFAPSLSAEGKTIIYQSDIGTGWELYESKLLSDGSWSEPIPLKEINEKCNFLAGPSLSYDGNTLYYTAFIEGVSETEDIYYSTRVGESQWSEPINIGEPINTAEDYEGFPSVSSDGNSLYFIKVNYDNAYNKKSKENCFKIYVSHKAADGTWGEPEALPETINSGCERDPRIMADNHTLIFSSIKPGGKGKYDMYQSRLQNDGSWSEPIALDYVNSEESDQSPGISASGDLIYFYSNDDIYVTEIPADFRQMINITVQGKVLVTEDGKPLRADVKVFNLESGELLATQKSSEADGRYSLVLQGGMNYEVEFSHPQYFPTKVVHELKNVESYNEIKSDINLASSYNMKFVVKDKDLDKVLPSFFTLSNGKSKLLFQDSLLAYNQPLNLDLFSDVTYKLVVKVPEYPEWEGSILFDPETFNKENDFVVEVPFEKVKVKANVTDIVSNQKMRLKVYFKNQDEDEVVISEDDEEVYLRKGNRYEVLTSSDKGYVFSSSSMVAGEGEMDAMGNYVINMEVMRIEKGMNLSLNNIVFDLNSAELDSVSYFGLDGVIELLNKNGKIKIEISAHTDDIGDEDYNLKLSEERAESVVKYLIDKGISVNRITPKGYGESVPKVPNDSDINRAINRRVELIVTGTGE